MRSTRALTARLLLETRASVAPAFKRQVGKPPAAWRRERRGDGVMWAVAVINP